MKIDDDDGWDCDDVDDDDWNGNGNDVFVTPILHLYWIAP
jgi:hypothetical protein